MKWLISVGLTGLHGLSLQSHLWIYIFLHRYRNGTQSMVLLCGLCACIEQFIEPVWCNFWFTLSGSWERRRFYDYFVFSICCTGKWVVHICFAAFDSVATPVKLFGSLSLVLFSFPPEAELRFMGFLMFLRILSFWQELCFLSIDTSGESGVPEVMSWRQKPLYWPNGISMLPNRINSTSVLASSTSERENWVCFRCDVNETESCWVTRKELDHPTRFLSQDPKRKENEWLCDVSSYWQWVT